MHRVLTKTFRGPGCALKESRYGAKHIYQPRRFESALPRIARPSLWASLIPKPFRKGSRSEPSDPQSSSREWNPATYFIVMSLLIGSNAIQLISLRTQRLNYQRDTEAKLSLLRKVIDRVQRGEDVDVAKELGTGVAAREQEWEEMIQDLQREEDIAEKLRRKRNARHEARAAREDAKQPEPEVAGPSDNSKPGFY